MVDFVITKTASFDSVFTDERFHCTVVVSKIGTTAQNLQVTDSLPAGVAFDIATGVGWACGEAGGVVTCTRPSLIGMAPPLRIYVTAPASAGTLTNTATVSADTSPSVSSTTTTEVIEDTDRQSPRLTELPTAVTSPSAPAANRFLGPNFPSLIDDGDGIPEEHGSDVPIPITFPDNDTITLDCFFGQKPGFPDVELTGSNPDGSGRFQTLTLSDLFFQPTSSRSRAQTLHRSPTAVPVDSSLGTWSSSTRMAMASSTASSSPAVV